MQYSWFHIIFAIGAMYVAMLLTDWYVFLLLRVFSLSRQLSCRNVVRTNPDSSDGNDDVYIGRSEVAMWMRVVSSWVCMALYSWSLLAPVLLPDRRVYSCLYPIVLPNLNFTLLVGLETIEISILHTYWGHITLLRVMIPNIH